MRIRRMGSAGGTTTFTVPEHQTGDLLITFAFRDGSVANPTIPSGWINLTNTLDGTASSVSVGYRFATSSSMTSGTWTNASRTICVVYRGVDINSPFDTGVGTTGTTNTVTYGARTISIKGSSWVLAFSGHVNTDTTLETVPPGLALVRNDVDTVAEVAAFDSNGAYESGNWPSTNVDITGTAGDWISYVIGIRPGKLSFQNYYFFASTRGGSSSFSERIK